MTTPVRLALRDRLTAALKSRDKQVMAAMRNVLAALENAEAVSTEPVGSSEATSEHVAGASIGVGAAETARRVLTEDDERAIVAGEMADLRDSAATMVAAGKRARADELAAMADVVEQVLAEVTANGV